MWILNVLLVLLFEFFILMFYIKDNKKWFLISLILSYLLAPLIRINNFELSSSYLYTATFVIIIFNELLQRRLRIGRKLTFFLATMSLSVVSMLLGLIINSSPSLSALFALSGYVQSFMVIACFSLYFGAIPKEKVNNLMFTAIGITTIANFVVTIIQFISVDFGYFVIKQFYAQQYRLGPIETFKTLGKITRGFGLTFSPVVLAVVMLVFSGWLIGQINDRSKSYKLMGLILFTTLTSFLAISKTSILGIVILSFAYIVIILVSPLLEKYHFSLKVLLNKSLKLILPIAVGVILAVLISDIFGLSFRRYLDVVTQPLNAFKTRYAVDDIDEIDSIPTLENRLPSEARRFTNDGRFVETREETELRNSEASRTMSTASDAATIEQSGTPIEEGILADTLRVIKRHPLIGVGPLAIEGEFIGDSQYAIILHHGGVLNALMYLLFYGYILVDHIMKRNTSEIFVLLMIAASGFAAVTIYMPQIGFLMGYCIRESLRSKQKNMFPLEVRG